MKDENGGDAMKHRVYLALPDWLMANCPKTPVPPPGVIGPSPPSPFCVEWPWGTGVVDARAAVFV